MVDFQMWSRTLPLVVVPLASSSLDSSYDFTFPCSSAMASFQASIVEETALLRTSFDIPFAKTSVKMWLE